jgi:hypothetical protein
MQRVQAVPQRLIGVRIEMTVTVQGEADRGMPGPSRDLLRVGARRNPQGDGRMPRAAALEAMTYLWARQPAKNLAAMEEAEALLEQTRLEDRPAWFDYYDPARLAGFNGLLRIRLVTPRPPSISSARPSPSCPLTRPSSAPATWPTRRPCTPAPVRWSKACQLGGEALQILSEVEYATGVQRVRDLRASLRTHRQHPAVAELTEQLLLVS